LIWNPSTITSSCVVCSYAVCSSPLSSGQGEKYKRCPRLQVPPLPQSSDYVNNYYHTRYYCPRHSNIDKLYLDMTRLLFQDAIRPILFDTWCNIRSRKLRSI
jgi:hypothetical protein